MCGLGVIFLLFCSFCRRVPWQKLKQQRRPSLLSTEIWRKTRSGVDFTSQRLKKKKKNICYDDYCFDLPFFPSFSSFQAENLLLDGNMNIKLAGKARTEQRSSAVAGSPNTHVDTHPYAPAKYFQKISGAGCCGDDVQSAIVFRDIFPVTKFPNEHRLFQIRFSCDQDVSHRSIYFPYPFPSLREDYMFFSNKRQKTLTHTQSSLRKHILTYHAGTRQWGWHTPTMVTHTNQRISPNFIFSSLVFFLPSAIFQGQMNNPTASRSRKRMKVELHVFRM